MQTMLKSISFMYFKPYWIKINVLMDKKIDKKDVAI